MTAPAGRVAGIPDDLAFQTKSQLALALVEHALDAGVPAAWVTADSVYGSDYRFRAAVEGRRLGYVVGVRSDEPVSVGGRRVPARSLLPEVPAAGWRRLSCGAGTKGPRVYDWARVPIRPLREPGWDYWLLVRRSLTDPTDLAYYVCFCPTGTSLAALVRVAGTRWAIEESFESAKGEVGLDHYEVRRWPGWYRHIRLALLAHAYLTVTRAAAVEKGEPKLPTCCP